MSEHTTITIQDSHNNTRIRIQKINNQICLTTYTYTPEKETETEAPTLTPEATQALTAILNHLTTP